MSRVFDLLVHEDDAYRLQGLELARSLGDVVLEKLFTKVQRGPWIASDEGMISAELLLALSSSEALRSRCEAIRELPGVRCSEGATVIALANAFPSARLRLLWEGTDLSFLATLPTRRLWLASTVRLQHEVGLSLSPQLESIAVAGWLATHIEHAPGLGDLTIVDAGLTANLDAVAPQLERLHLFSTGAERPISPNEFPRLRDLRAPLLPRELRTRAPLERLHIGRAEGRRILDHPVVGSDTHLRVDLWHAPEPELRGDPRPVWVGPSEDPQWDVLLPTLPRLEVVSLRPSWRRSLRLPPAVLPAPQTLWEPEFRSGSDTYRRALREWAAKGRACRLRCLQTNPRKIPALNQIRTLTRLGLREAKLLFDAAQSDRLVALSRVEATEFQAILALASVHTAIES
ncbi:MAG: hypothetical protein AAGE52_18355 [Myxococcota bacterium]